MQRDVQNLVDISNDYMQLVSPPTPYILQHYTKAKTIFPFSSSVFSGSIDTAGSVTHNVLWAFFFIQLFVT